MRSRNRRRLKVVIVLVALYAAIGFFALPPVLKWDLEKRLTAELGRPVSIGQVRTNPFALSVTLSRVNLRVPDGSASMVTWDRLHVNFDPVASFRREWVLGDLALDGLQVAVEVRADGSLNFSDLIEKYRPPEDRAPARPRASWPWRVRRLNVTTARIEFLDNSRATPFQTTVGPVNFTVLDFRTAGIRGAPGRFEAVSEAGEKLTWIGTLTAAPVRSRGELRLENLLLPKYAPYLAERMRATIRDGRLGLSASYDVDLSPNSRRIALRDGAVQLKDFRVAERPGGAPVVDLRSLEVAGVTADGLTSRVTVDSVRVEGGRVEARREADGSINLLGLFPVRAAPDADEVEPMDVSVKEIAVRDLSLEWRDVTTPRPVAISFSRVAGSWLNVSSTAPAAMPVELTLDWAPRGTVRVNGNLMRKPLVADLTLELGSLPLGSLSPYLEQTMAAEIERGVASMKGQVRLTEGAGGAAEVKFSGEGHVEDFSLVAAGGGEELAGFSDFAVRDVRLATAPGLVVSVADVSLNAPRARLARNEDGTFNLASLAPAGGERAKKERGANEGPGVARADADVTVTRVAIAGGDFTFDDRSMSPPVRFALKQAGGTLRNFSSRRPELGSVDVRAMVNGTAPVTVIGRLNPLAAQPFADLLVEAKSIDLAPAGPYVARFAGYRLESGKLFLDTKAKLADEQLDLRNTVTLENFTLGQATPGPDAVKMPVKLGIALLKDAEGRIVLELPVQGSLADPKFDVSQVVGGVLTGLLTKAATSPFSLLGSMFGGGGEELAQQDFPAGEVTPTEESARRLVTVQRALAARPALTLEIEAGYDPAADAEALKERKLDEMLRRELAREAGGETPTEQERANAIRRVFAQKFPEGVSMGPAMEAAPERSERGDSMLEAETRAQEPAEPQERAEPEEEDRSLIGRAWDIATFKGPRDWWSGRRERKEAEERREREEERQRATAAAKERAVREQEAAPAFSGEQRSLSVEEMENRLADTVAVTSEDLTALARARAERVRAFIMADGRVAPERVKIVEMKAEGSGLNGARSVLHLQ